MCEKSKKNICRDWSALEPIAYSKKVVAQVLFDGRTNCPYPVNGCDGSYKFIVEATGETLRQLTPEAIKPIKAIRDAIDIAPWIEAMLPPKPSVLPWVQLAEDLANDEDFEEFVRFHALRRLQFGSQLQIRDIVTSLAYEGHVRTVEYAQDWLDARARKERLDDTDREELDDTDRKELDDTAREELDDTAREEGWIKDLRSTFDSKLITRPINEWQGQQRTYGETNGKDAEGNTIWRQGHRQVPVSTMSADPEKAQALLETADKNAVDPLQQLINKEDCQRIMSAIESLKPVLKNVVLLWLENHPLDEIAKSLFEKLVALDKICLRHHIIGG